MPVADISPETSTPETASPGFSESRHPETGFAVRGPAPEPPCTAVIPICEKKGEKAPIVCAENPESTSGVSIGVMIGDDALMWERRSPGIAAAAERFAVGLSGVRASMGRD